MRERQVRKTACHRRGREVERAGDGGRCRRQVGKAGGEGRWTTCPHWPSSLEPAANTLPQEVRKRVCALPVATSTTSYPERAFTMVGTNLEGMMGKEGTGESRV